MAVERGDVEVHYSNNTKTPSVIALYLLFSLLNIEQYRYVLYWHSRAFCCD